MAQLDSETWSMGVLLSLAVPELVCLGWLLRLLCAQELSALKVRCAQAWRAVRFRRDKELDLADRMVLEQLLRLRVSQFCIAAKFLGLMWCLATLIVMKAIVAGDDRAHTCAMDVLHLVIQGTFTALILRPSLITPRTLSAAYCLLVLCLTLRNLPFVNKASFALVSAMSGNLVVFTLTIYAGAIRGSMLLANLLYGTLTAWSMLIHAKAEGAATGPVHAFAQVAATVCMSFGAHYVDQNIVQALYCRHKAQDAEELYAAACALLRSCCEVVVELDDQGLVVDCSTDLNSFLLRGTSESHGFPGQRLADLIADEDERTAFLQRLHKPKLKGLGLAENMSVSMKDACGNCLKLELLWFQYQQYGGRLCYMLGIREPADETITGSPQANIQLTTEDMHGLPETMSVSSGNLEEHAAVAAVDTTVGGFPLRSVSSEFSMRVGRLPVGLPFMNYMTRPDEFGSWLQDAVGKISEGSSSSDFHITLRMPQGHMKAVCRVLTNSRSKVASSKVNSEFVRLVFYNIRLKREGHYSAVAVAKLPSPRRSPLHSPRPSVDLRSASPRPFRTTSL